MYKFANKVSYIYIYISFITHLDQVKMFEIEKLSYNVNLLVHIIHVPIYPQFFVDKGGLGGGLSRHRLSIPCCIYLLNRFCRIMKNTKIMFIKKY